MATAINERVPPLAAGDHLTRDEFLCRWKADPSVRFAELIGNVVYMTSPVFGRHGGVENDVRLARADLHYRVLPPDADGLWRSRVFPGLWLDGRALLAGNLRQVLDRLQDGLRSPEHEQFVAQLAARRKG